MKVENRNANDGLKKQQRVISWELALLIVLLMTVLGVALRGPLKTFPRLDPYDLRNERSISDNRSHVEIGL